MRRVYRRCGECRQRMTKVAEDQEGQRAFYLCRCGYRESFDYHRNLIRKDRPAEVFKQAVQDGYLTADGKARI